MKTDDVRRDKFGLVVSIRDEDDGRTKIILDDVKNVAKSGAAKWNHQTFMTWKEFDSDELGNMEFTEKEMAAFGQSILARLITNKTS